MGAFAHAVYRAIVALCRRTDEANVQMIDVFSATEKKERAAGQATRSYAYFSYLYYTYDLPPIFSFNHSTVSRIVLLSGLGE